MDTLFAALADPTRRGVVERLTRGEAPIKELAAPHDMALPSFMKHIDRLEDAGLVTTRKVGRQRIVALTPDAFAPAETWLERQKRAWEERLDRLGDLAVRLEADSTDDA
jgi:DNA-binding transcriptional ArsR family regulator